MKLTQMWPRKTLDPLDLAALVADERFLSVTIERIDYKTLEARNPGDAEIAYYIKFVELAKPTKLSKTFADQIAACLGTDDTAEWKGRVISITPAKIMVPALDGSGRKVPITVVNCDLMAPRKPPGLRPNTDITGLQFAAASGAPRLQPGQPPTIAAGGVAVAANATLGDDRAARLIVSLRTRGKSWEDAVRHCKSMGMGELIAGKIPADAALAVMPSIVAFGRSFPKVADVPDAEQAVAELKAAWAPPQPTAETMRTPAASVRGEVIDPSTGEVVQAPRPPASESPILRPVPIVHDDDVPF